MPWLRRPRYNIGLNAGADAGQAVMHIRVHVIPRYRRAVADPEGGVRAVIPGRQRYRSWPS